jgi:hypothetical protein
MHIVMPNHFHGILLVGAQFIAPPCRMRHDPIELPGVMNHAPTLGKILRAFKAVSTRRIRNGNTPGFAWQRNYYERIIRGEKELEAIRRYIADNPMRWDLDRENPCNRA